jgi:hypothetical protein
MSYSIFPATFVMPRFREFRAFETEEARAGGGRSVRASIISTAGLLVARGGLRLPDANGKTFADMAAFVEGLQGGADSFLYLPWWNRHRKADETMDPGTGTRSDWAVSKRYVDVSTVVVKKNGATQTLTTHYTLQDLAGGAYALGDTGMQVHFVSAPAFGDTIEVLYSYYYPMIFEDDDVLDQLGTQATSGSDETLATFYADEIRIRQDFPGSERVTIPVV